MRDRAMGADRAIPADPDPFTNDRVSTDQAAASDFGRRSDHRKGIDGHAITDFGSRMHRCVGRSADGAERRGRTQRRAIELAGNHDEGVIRFVHAQHGNVSGRVAGKAFAGQHGARFGRGKRVRELGVLEEGEVAGLGLIDGRNAGQATAEIGAGVWLRAGQRGDVRHAQPLRR